MASRLDKDNAMWISVNGVRTWENHTLCKVVGSEAAPEYHFVLGQVGSNQDPVEALCGRLTVSIAYSGRGARQAYARARECKDCRNVKTMQFLAE